MTTRLFRGACNALLLIAATTLSAQTYIPEQPPPAFGSLHGITSPRALALGHSFVARSGAIDAWKSNPAAITGTASVGAYHTFGRHALETAITRSNSVADGVWLTIPAATLAVHYTRDEFDPIWRSGSPDTAYSSDRTIAVTLATNLPAPFSFGISVHSLRDETELRLPPGSDDGDIFILERSGTYIDLGALVSLAGMMDGTSHRDSIRFGMAVLNLGGELEGWGMERESAAQRIRIGGAYDLISTDTSGPAFRASLTAEYSRILNTASSLDYGGIGLETIINDIFSLRVGMRLHPSVDLDNPRATMRVHPSLTTSMGVFGTGSIETSPWYSFGFGINLPLRRIGIDLPITVGADYGHPIPRDSDNYDDHMLKNSVFEFRLSYANPLLE